MKLSDIFQLIFTRISHWSIKIIDAEGEIPKLIFMVMQCLPQRCITKSPIIPISWQMSSFQKELICFS